MKATWFDVAAIVATVYTLLGTAYYFAQQLGLVVGILLYALALGIAYRVVLWFNAYRHPAA